MKPVLLVLALALLCSSYLLLYLFLAPKNILPSLQSMEHVSVRMLGLDRVSPLPASSAPEEWSRRHEVLQASEINLDVVFQKDPPEREDQDEKDTRNSTDHSEIGAMKGFGTTEHPRWKRKERQTRLFTHPPYGVPHTVINPNASNDTLHMSAGDISDVLYSSMCPNYTTRPEKIIVFEDILLIVTINYYFLYVTIPFVELLYRRHFPTILYCGPSPRDLENFVIEENYTFPILYMEGLRDGWFTMYECLENAAKTYTNFSGYLYIGDDTLLHLPNLATLPKDTLWMSEIFYFKKPMNTTSLNKQWIWWADIHGNNAFLGVLNELMFRAFRQKDRWALTFLENYYSHVRSSTGVHICTVDMLYVPHRLVPNFLAVVPLMKKHHLTLEIAMPMFALGLDWDKDVTLMKVADLWGSPRGEPWKHFKDEIIYLHPFKYGDHFQSEEGYDFICGKYLHQLY